MNGGKQGIGKKSNAMLNGVQGGGSNNTHGQYGPIGGGLGGIRSGGSSASNTMSGFGGMGGMNMNVYKQNSGNNSNMKESL